MQSCRKKFLNIILLSFFSATSQSAGYDCSLPLLTEIERLICNTPALSQLDDDLNHAYKLQLQNSKNGVAIKARQRFWIQHVRNQCDTIKCLKTVYTQHIYTLKFDSAWMTEERANAICRDVRDLADKETLYKRFIPFTSKNQNEDRVEAYNSKNRDKGYSIGKTLKLKQKQGFRELGQAFGDGSCLTSHIVDLNASVFAPYPPDDEDENLHRSSWDAFDKLLLIQNELIIVAVRGLDSIGLVSWLAPDGAKRPLCYLEATPDNFKSIILESQNKALCQAVISGNIDIVPWKEDVKITLEENLHLKYFDSISTAEIDINLDGKLETLGFFDYASGAGCGGYQQWLSVIKKPQGSAKKWTLDPVLHNLVSGPLGGNWSLKEMNIGVGAIRLFYYKNKPYIIAHGEKKDASVVSVWGNKLKTWCEYDFLPFYNIKINYPPKTWPMPIPITETDNTW